MMRAILLAIGLFAATELALLLLAAGAAGGWLILFWCVLTGVAGIGLIRLQGIALLARLSRQQGPPALPQAALSGALIALAGLMLLMPGLISDAAGIVLALPATRRRLTRRLTPPAAEDAGVTVIEGDYRRRPPY